MNLDLFGPVEPKPKVEHVPHVLVAHGNDEWDIEHPSSCPVVQEDGWERYDCAVDFEVSNSGIGAFFADDTEDPSQWGYVERVRPGRYWVRVWYETHYHHEYGPEYSSGIELIYPEEAAA